MDVYVLRSSWVHHGESDIGMIHGVYGWKEDAVSDMVEYASKFDAEHSCEHEHEEYKDDEVFLYDGDDFHDSEEYLYCWIECREVHGSPQKT